MKWIMWLLLLMLMLTACQEKKYCGIVIDKGYENPVKGLLKSKSPVYFIILRVDGNYMRVNATVPTFTKATPGIEMCFNLTESEFLEYGNMHISN